MPESTPLSGQGEKSIEKRNRLHTVVRTFAANLNKITTFCNLSVACGPSPKMAAYFGEGARSRRVLRDEDILKLIQDGNDSDIEELHDDGEDFFDPDIAPLSPGHPQHLLTPQEQSSNEVVTQNFTTGRTVTWKQTTFNDKEHNYPCQPSGLVRLPAQYIQDYFQEDFY
ncbi:hypothetical protein evm_015065 [Chilo suppressalis]|nr:hypothetical protein evm_015065 [Chilo suppressalis]